MSLKHIIAYKKQEEGKLSNLYKIVDADNENTAISNLCNQEGIPEIQISQDDDKEGYVVCQVVRKDYELQ